MKYNIKKCRSGRWLCWHEDMFACGETEAEAIKNFKELRSAVRWSWLKTWHLELAAVSVILCTVTFLFANNLVNWVTTLAILVTFNHGIIGDRLQEKQGKMDRPTVECYWKLNRLFAAKEVLWTIAFLIMQNYAAIVGSVLFFLYPFWRRYYRRRIKPL